MAKQKDLDKEGITKEFLSTLSVKKLGNPVQLLPNDEPINLIKCMAGFWVSLDGEILKNEKNEYLVISDKEALIGRARYLLNFKDEIKSQKIEQEIERLKNLVDKKLDYVLDQMQEILIYSGHIVPSGFKGTLYKIMEAEESQIMKRDKALEIVDEETVKLYENLKKQKELNEKKDYNSLYVFLIQKGLNEIASFDTTNPKHINALIRNFNRDKIESTIIEIQSSDHLYNIAKFNIEKQLGFTYYEYAGKFTEASKINGIKSSNDILDKDNSNIDEVYNEGVKLCELAKLNYQKAIELDKQKAEDYGYKIKEIDRYIAKLKAKE